MPTSVITFMLGLLGLAGSALLTGCGRGDRVQLVLEAKSGAASDGVMESARATIERRISAYGSSGATVARRGPNRILVTLDRRADAEEVKALVGRSGRLEFRLVDMAADPDQIRSGRAPPGSEILPFARGEPEENIAVRKRRIITGSMIVDAAPVAGAAGKSAVGVHFDAAGSRRFAEATRENVGLPFAIVLDGAVISAPLITEPILGGQAQIVGFTPEEATRMAIALRSGPLPIDLTVIEERVLAR